MASASDAVSPEGDGRWCLPSPSEIQTSAIVPEGTIPVSVRLGDGRGGIGYQDHDQLSASSSWASNSKLAAPRPGQEGRENQKARGGERLH